MKYAIKLANTQYGYFICRETDGYLTTTNDINDPRCHKDLEKAKRILANTLSFGIQHCYSADMGNHSIVEVE